MANAIDKTVRAQGGAVVKPHQVKAMILAARRAYEIQLKAGMVADGVSFDAWRRATIHDVVGCAAPDSFRTVTQHDYIAVMEYFGQLAGEKNIGMGSKLKCQDADEVRRAWWSYNLVEGELADAFGGRDGVRRYAEVLFAKIHKTNLTNASARQIWAVIFTLRKRAFKIRSKTAIGEQGEFGGHLSLPPRSKRFPAFSRGF